MIRVQILKSAQHLAGFIVPLSAFESLVSVWDPDSFLYLHYGGCEGLRSKSASLFFRLRLSIAGSTSDVLEESPLSASKMLVYLGLL